MRMERSAPTTATPNGDDEQPEQAEQHQSHADAAGLFREEERQEDDRRDLGDGGPGYDELPELRAHLTCVLQHRNHDPERGCREHDGDEERRPDEPACIQGEADQEREPERERVSERGEVEQPAAKALVLDLEAGKKEEEGEAEQAQHLDRRVDRDPAQHLRADRDPEHDLQHDGGQAQLREKPERERCAPAQPRRRSRLR
jgi:hypothetical protein